MAAQLVNECEGEVVFDSDDERMVGTEVVTTGDGMCSGVTCLRVFRKGLDFKNGKFSPSSEQHIAGNSQRVFSSVNAHSSQGSGLAKRNMTNKANDNQSSKQIVLEDDETSRVKDQYSVGKKVKGVMNGRDSREGSGSMEDSADRNKVFFSNIESPDSGCLARLDYAGSQEPGESSQAKALEYVDRFLLSNNVGYSEGVDTRKILKEKSPLVSSTNGSQSLAKLLNLRSSIRDKGSFEWVDSHHDGACDVLSNKVEAFFDCEGHGTRPQRARYLGNEGGTNSGFQCEEKKEELPNSFKEVMGPPNTDASDDLKDYGNIAQVSETRIGRNLIKELDAESPGQQFEPNIIGRDADDIFDGVFNTQMAAEVMETLSYQSPADDVFGGRLNPPEDSSGVAKDKVPLEHPSFKRRPCSAPGFIARNSKRLKMPGGKLSKQNSSPQKPSKRQKELDLELTIRRKEERAKSFAENDVNCRNYVNASRSSGRRSSKPIKQRKREKSADDDSNKVVEQNLNSVISVEHTSLGERQSEALCRTLSPIAHRTRHVKPPSSLKRTKDLSHNSRDGTNVVLEVDVKYRRKRSLARSIRRDYPKLGPHITEEARSGKQSQEEQASLSIAATTSCLKLDVWSYPKGKRTRRNVPGRLNGARNIYAPLTAVGRKEGICHSANSMNMLKDSVETKSTFPFRESSGNNLDGSLRRQNLDKPDSADKQNNPLDPVRADASLQSSKPDLLESISSADVAEQNFKVEDLSNEEVKQCGSESNTNFNCTKGSNVESPSYKCYGHHKRPCSKNLPRSSLVKELIQLGSPEIIPIFSSKQLRRRRDMVHIRVLFSQHLDDDMIKHQKKILRRLGISIASCSLDATHFIADKFARTRNMLEAIAMGKPVVTHLWLESCGQASCYIDEKSYILRDAKKEKEIGFRMPVSLTSASQHPLLKGHKVLITPNVRPDIEMIASLVKAVHGQAVETIQDCMDEKIIGDLTILSCEQDYPICVPFLDKGAAVYSSELLLNGIIIQKLEYGRHQLFTDHVKKNCSSLCSRKAGKLPHFVTKCK